MNVHYLEIVTPDVDRVCAQFAAGGGVFGEPVPELGNARVLQRADGSAVGVRAPMSEQEGSVVRPYWLVDDIEAAVTAATAGGGMLAHPPMEIPGRGHFAVLIDGDVQYGFWQV